MKRHHLIVVPAALAALTLSACQEEAPTAAAPTPSAPSTQASVPTTAAPSAPSTTDSPSAPSTTEPAPPSTDTGSTGGSGGCETTSSYKIRKGSIAAKPLNTVQVGSYKSGDGKVDISFGAPTVNASTGDTFFPGDGKQAVIYPVTIKMKEGRSFISTRLAFGLVDDKDAACSQDVLGSAVPRGEQIPIEIMRSGDSVSAKIAFAVPAGADLSKYTLVFADNYQGGQAELAWTAK